MSFLIPTAHAANAAQNIVQGVGGAFAQGLAEGIAAGLVYVLLITLAVLAASFLLGLIFLIFAVIFYYRRKPKLFLLFAFLSNFFLSILIGIFASAALTNAPFGAFVFTPLIFILSGIWIVLRYRNIKRS